MTHGQKVASAIGVALVALFTLMMFIGTHAPVTGTPRDVVADRCAERVGVENTGALARCIAGVRW